MERVSIYDTTLRDGAQGEGISFTVADKLAVVERLDDLRVDYIEGGWPGSNAKDLEFFRQLRLNPPHNSRVVAFTSTRKKGTRIEEDDHMRAVLGTGMKHCAVVGKTWDFHVERALRTDLSENLAMIRDTVTFLKEKDIEVIFDAEHFFDGYKRSPGYALEALAAARDAGADWLALCDTNGGALPHEVAAIVHAVRDRGFNRIGIHAHNDGGLAVANSLAAVQAGATQVQATINGFGERCGNTDLCVVVPNLVLKLGLSCGFDEDLPRLREASEHLYALVRTEAAANQPFVGRSAFAHKAGIHVSAVLRDPALYEHIAPERVGNERRVLVSELSGVSNVLYRLQTFGLSGSNEDAQRILKRLKWEEELGAVFEGADSTLYLLMREELGIAESSARLLEASVRGCDHGVCATVGWLDRHGQKRKAAGSGSVESEALWDACGLPSARVELRACRTEPVDRHVGDRVFRARVAADWPRGSVDTMALGDTAAQAMAGAMLQVLDYVAARDGLETQSAAEARAIRLSPEG